jgi:hypothetical protein
MTLVAAMPLALVFGQAFHLGLPQQHVLAGQGYLCASILEVKLDSGQEVKLDSGLKNKFDSGLSQLPLLMFLAGCALLTWILMKRSGRYFGRASRGRSSKPIEVQPRPTSSWSGVQRDALARIDREHVELQERARDLAGQLNSKIIVLEQLIATSSRQIERMETLLAQSVPQESREEPSPMDPVPTATIPPASHEPKS